MKPLEMVKHSPSDQARSLDLTGGESVYCINEKQMERALRLLETQGADGALRARFDGIVSDFSRNEQAALAFLIIDHLNKS